MVVGRFVLGAFMAKLLRLAIAASSDRAIRLQIPMCDSDGSPVKIDVRHNLTERASCQVTALRCEAARFQPLHERTRGGARYDSILVEPGAEHPEAYRRPGSHHDARA